MLQIFLSILFLIGAVEPLIAGSKYTVKEKKALNDYFSSSTKKVAILPFLNSFKGQDKYPEANINLTNSVISALWKKNKVIIINKNEVTRVLKELKVNPITGLNDTDMFQIGKQLECDAIVYGNIEVYKISTKIGLSLARIFKLKCQIDVYDMTSGMRIGGDKVETKEETGDIISRTLSGKSEEEKRERIIETAGIVLTWYMPAPKKASGATVMDLGSLALNVFTDIDIDVDRYEQDITWKVYPPNYFLENIGFTAEDYDKIR